LALGIGANTAIYSVVDRMLTRALPVVDPNQLALIAQPLRNGQFEYDFNYPLFRDYQRENSVFRQLTAVSELAVGVGEGGETDRQRALLVSGNYFTALGVNPAIGRMFAPNEGVEIDDGPVVVLSYGLWQRKFGAQPQVIGRSILVNGKPFTIVGVAPREFTGTTRGQVPGLYVPITMFGQLTDERPGGQHPLNTRYFTWHQMFGRLKEGITQAQGQAAMQSLSQRIQAINPVNTSTNLVLLPGFQGFTDGVREARLPLKFLFATAGLVLLIACANLANLQLARASARSRDFAVRLALGARRGRLVRELLAESILLSLLGGGLGLLVANWLAKLLEQFSLAGVSIELGTGLDSKMLGFALLVSVVTGIVFGLAPALRASRPQLVNELKGGGNTTEGQSRRWNLRGALVVVQVALSLLVLASAGLCVRSLKKLELLDPGFQPAGVVMMSFDLGLNGYKPNQAHSFYAQLLERVRSLPGIEAAGLVQTPVLTGRSPGMSINRAEGYEKKPNEQLGADFNIVSPDYFKTLNIPIAQGREFTEADTSAALKTVIVSESLANRFWPNQNAVGHKLFLPGPGAVRPVEVVGVVRSTRSRRLSDQPRASMFFPEAQESALNLTLMVRSGADSAVLIGTLRSVVKSLDSNVPVFGVQTLAQQKSGSLALQRMAAILLSSFGFLALFLASLGIYGVLAYSVNRRTREIGVRMALGAQISDVLTLVMRQGSGLIVVGIALGLAASLAATRLLRGFLYEVQPLDPLTFAVVVMLLTGVAMLACWLPARRAARIDPIQALRYE
jgi:predicted permease